MSTKPDDIPQDVKAAALAALEVACHPAKSSTDQIIEAVCRAILAERRRALSGIDTLTESLQEGLMTDADLTEADRAAMRHQLTALEVAATDIRNEGA